jgi:hypothetical protein
VRNKFYIFLLTGIILTAKVFADTTSIAADSSVKPFVPPDNGPLGIDHITGLALYAVAILFAVLIIALWRTNIIKR